MDGSVAADRDQVALTAKQSVPRGLGGVAGTVGARYAVAEPGVPQHALDLRQRGVYLPPPGPGVGDDDQRAEGLVTADM